jgi:hypothetical protein
MASMPPGRFVDTSTLTCVVKSSVVKYLKVVCKVYTLKFADTSALTIGTPGLLYYTTLTTLLHTSLLSDTRTDTHHTHTIGTPGPIKCMCVVFFFNLILF